MEWLLRCLQLIMNFVYFFVNQLLNLLLPPKSGSKNEIPPIKNEILLKPLVEVISEMRKRKIKSIQLVQAYIQRTEEVNPHLNAVVENRFNDALKEAERADGLIAKTQSLEQLHALFSRYPLLGIPFTVKESCGVKGMSHVVGSLARTEMCSADNGAAIEELRAAGAIPLLVSANPEYCFCIETISYVNGITLNAYDKRRSSGGSSGGEGALNGAGASLFGVGSDIAGSIRLPSLFNGVFGHKPTGGLVSARGHFPNSTDDCFEQYLQIGPITRFARDLGLLMQVMAGPNASKLDLMNPPETKSIKIYYALGFGGLNGFLHHSVDFDIQLAIMKAVKYFENKELFTMHADMKVLNDSFEISAGGIADIKNFDYLMNTENPNKVSECFKELGKAYIKKSKYTKEGVTFEIFRRTNGFMPAKCLEKYKHKAAEVKKEIISLLGNSGVLFFPTFPVPAIHHHSSSLAQWNIDYPLIFNILGLPCTHIPMGLNGKGLPIGFQVIAAPFMDKLCFQIAGELEAVFGGWQQPTKIDN